MNCDVVAVGGICTDDLVSECGRTDVLDRNTPMPSLPPDHEMNSRRMDLMPNTDTLASTTVSQHRASASRLSRGSPSVASSVMLAATARESMPASGGSDMPTLPKLELKEPTLAVKIIEIKVPWLFWVQIVFRKKQELEDILELLE